MDPSDQILRQLQWLKWLTALIALSFAAIAVAVAWATYEVNLSLDRTKSSSEFSDEAKSLLEQGKETELLALCAEHEKKLPKNPYLHWYRGKAHYQLGQFADALIAI